MSSSNQGMSHNQRRRRRRWRKLLLVAGGLLLGAAAAEGMLRLLYADLPSLANLRHTPYRVRRFEVRGMMHRRRDTDLRCKETTYLDRARNKPGILDADRVARERFAPPAAGTAVGPPLSLWVIGDSVTAGMGVEPGQAFGFGLARGLARATKRRVELLNLGMPGAGYCALLRRTHAALDRRKPGLVVVALFADDLEDRAMMAAYGKPVIFVQRIPRIHLRVLVSRSYLANLVWFSHEARAPRWQRRFVDAAGQKSFERGMVALERRIRREGGKLLVVLLAPVGFPGCPTRPLPHSRCEWMARDLALMSELLRARDLPLLDLSRLWHQKPARAAARERALDLSWLAIHPDAAGHRSIATAILPALTSRASQKGRRSP